MIQPGTATRKRRVTATATAAILALLLAAAPSVPASAADEEEVRIGALTDLDRRYMAQQRKDLDELAREEIGASFSGATDDDIALLQRMLDEGLVTGEDRRLLQGMGIVLGDLLARELDMHWVIYEDPVGRSRALRYRESDNYLFPTTMIARRREAGDETPVAAIYAKAVAIIRPLQDPLPFQ